MSTVRNDRAAANNNRTGVSVSRRRSGSETRKPSKLIHVRYPLEEFEHLEKRAEDTGLTLSALVRQLTNGMTPASDSKRKSPQLRLAAQHLAALGKIGSNINQFVRAVHLRQAEAADVSDALSEIQKLKAMLQRILREGS